jgi:regulator of protease activity HflC (stomatin/prohibitin superfamily)
MRTFAIASLSLVALGAGTGCAGVAIEPGHRALYFDPSNGGIQHEVLQPGWYATPCPFWQPSERCPRVDDFDVTYSTSKEHVNTLSEEGLPLQLDVAVVYRPIVAELYALDTEIGRNYFDEVIGPEFRSAAIGVFAHNSYSNLQKKNGDIEDQIEKALRERLRGKHVEISSVLIEKVTYAPEILESERERVVSQEQTLRNKQLLENQALQRKRELELAAETKKLELENQTAQKKMELQAQAEQQKLAATTELEVKKIEIQKTTDEEKFRIDSELRNKQAERRLTLEQADIDRLKAESGAVKRVTEAGGESRARIALARALTEENKAAAAAVSPMQVMMHAYDALGQLGGSGTNLMLGDWSKVPSFLFPRVPAFQSAFMPWYTWPSSPATTAPTAPTADSKVSQRDPTPAP